MIYTGSTVLDEALSRSGSRFVVVYGGPGSGKTNLVLKILRESVSRGLRGLYISTEGSIQLSRLYELVEDRHLDNILVATPASLTELLKVFIESIDTAVDIVVIDSINYLYRIEAGSSYRSNEMFLSVLALTSLLSRISDRFFLYTAQVRETEEGEEPSGIDLMRFYDPYMIRSRRVSGDTHEITLEREGLVLRFRIEERDVVWT